MIRPIDMQMILPQTAHVGTQQQNAEQHAAVQSAQGSAEMAKEVQQHAETVIAKENPDLMEYRYDAKEKGNNSYEGRKQKKRKQEETSEQQTGDQKTSWVNFDIQI